MTLGINIINYQNNKNNNGNAINYVSRTCYNQINNNKKLNNNFL